MHAWRDDTKRPLADKLAWLLSAYADRYGRSATLILVNADEEPVTMAGVEVRESHGPGEGIIEKNTYWLGQQ